MPTASGPLMRLCLLLLLCCNGGSMQAQRPDNYRSYLLDTSVEIDATNLPIVFIDTQGQMIQTNQYIAARMKIIAAGEGLTNHGDTLAHPAQPADYEGWIALKYRGHSSFSLSDKKPLAFRTLESSQLPADGGAKKKVKLLGMAKDNKWCFIAPWCDQTMFRDVLSFELGRPWFDWVPHARVCELILDGTYYGVYVLCERVSKGKHRLDLNDPGQDDGDLTGDYHVTIDHGTDPYFTSSYRPWLSLDGSQVHTRFAIRYEYGDPDNDEFAALPTGTRSALRKQVGDMEASFLAADWQSPLGGYRQHIDVQSFIDYMLSTEMSMNVDGYRLSTHLYQHSKARAASEGIDPRWKLTLWDYNIAWGNANYYDGERTDGWQYEFNVKFTSDASPVPFYWYRMLQDTAYVEALKARWAQYRQGNYATSRILATVDSLATLITQGGAARRNEQAWGMFARQAIWPVPYYATDHADAVSHLKEWILLRLDFMDSQLLPPDVAAIRTLPAATPDTSAPAAIYSPGGTRQPRMRPGLNIVRRPDGSVRKVMVPPGN